MQNITIHLLSYFFIIRICWYSTHVVCWYSICNICWYRICHICWYSVCDIYNFITHNYQQYFLNTYHFTNTWARIPAIIFFARIIPFTLARVFVNIPFFIWMRCCTIEFEFTTTWNIFYRCFCFIYFCYHIAYFNIFVFCFTGNTYFRR